MACLSLAHFFIEDFFFLWIYNNDSQTFWSQEPFIYLKIVEDLGGIFCFFLIFKKILFLFLFRESGREEGRERNIDV